MYYEYSSIVFDVYHTWYMIRVHLCIAEVQSYTTLYHTMPLPAAPGMYDIQLLLYTNMCFSCVLYMCNTEIDYWV